MKIQVLMIGKVQQKAYEVLIQEYLQRCRGRLTVEVIHCKNDEEMEKRARLGEWRIGLDEHGRAFSSMQFSQWLDGHLKRGVSRLTVCLGGATGLGSGVRALSQEFLTLSPFTLNHQLALLTFAEQLYRGLSILNGEPYHKP
jgi:23S rRNA (pseudouridine1915-N3)-methyltransferase